jgi:hypothetical protein
MGWVGVTQPPHDDACVTKYKIRDGCCTLWEKRLPNQRCWDTFEVANGIRRFVIVGPDAIAARRPGLRVGGAG